MKGLRGRAALAVAARVRLVVAAAVAAVWRQNATHVASVEDLEERIEDAERRARNSASCAQDYRDEALGHDRRGEHEDAEKATERAASSTEREEQHLRTAQAFRNEQRARAYAARKYPHRRRADSRCRRGSGRRRLDGLPAR